MTLRWGLEPKQKQELDAAPTATPRCHPGALSNELLSLIRYVLLKENVRNVEQVNANLNHALHFKPAIFQGMREKNVKNEDMVRVGC